MLYSTCVYCFCQLALTYAKLLIANCGSVSALLQLLQSKIKTTNKYANYPKEQQNATVTAFFLANI